MQMKSFLSLFFGLILSFNTFSQLKEGRISYEITMETDDPELSLATTMMEGSSMNIYFSEKKTRTDIDMSVMNVSTVLDQKNNKVLMLMSGMLIGKMAVTSTTDELKKYNDESTGEEDEYKVELVKGKKKIAGYKCKKAILTNGNGAEITYWYTTKIKFNKDGQTSFNKEVPGVPLQFETNQNGIQMTFSATSVYKKIKGDKDQIFSTDVPDGYEEMSLEELKEDNSIKI